MIYIFEDSKLDGIDQWDSLRTARESKRNEIIYNIDDLRPEIGGHAAIRYAFLIGLTILFFMHCSFVSF